MTAIKQMDPEPMRNPFLDDVVTDPARPVAADVDVEEIHREAFARCREGYENVVRDEASWSVLLYGPAGCGKTHVLARFRRWLGQQGGAGRRPVFVAVRMETAPSMVWRHLRRRFAEQLLSAHEDNYIPLRELLRRFAEGHASLGRAFDEREVADLTLDLRRVLEHYERGERLEVCKAWLKGDPLNQRDLDDLRLSWRETEDVEEESGEATARQVVLALIRLAAPLPVVLCLDQIEALQLGLTGNRGFGLFSKMVASLVDDTRNSLVISSILIDYVNAYQQGSMQSDLSRVRKSESALHPLNWRQGRALVSARLAASRELQRYRTSELAPLAEDRLREAFQQGACTARALIHHARALFDQWQRGSAAPATVPELGAVLAGLFERLLEESGALQSPYETEQVLLHALPAVAPLAGYEARPSEKAHIDLEVGGGGGARLISVCQHAHMTGLASRLRRLLNELEADERRRLVMVRDARMPISTGARKTRARLAELERGGARLLRVGPEEVAALDAIRKLLARAESGELSHEGREIGAGSVREWLAQNLPEQARRMFENLREGPKPEAGALDPLVEFLQRQKVVLAEEAAASLALTPREIEEHALANPDQIGYLAGPPAVLFHVVPANPGGVDEPA